MTRSISLAFSLLLFAAQAAISQERIVIGQSAPLTGANADSGKDIRDGAAAYFRKVNEAGGVSGRQIEFLSLDDKNDRKVAGANAVRLVNENNACIWTIS